jgi:O-antigen biosynthesis protein
MTANSVPPACQPITIVVPVYRNLQVTRACLESLIASNLPGHASIVVINDCSPETELSAFCSDLAARAGLRLVLNESNLGFVKTANQGFTLDPDADVLLLNSDTVVSSDWLQRLQSCAYREESIGTVTPFSNNATICSYPVFPVANKLPANWSVAELDRAFQQANSGSHSEIPTAVGFCMYIRRSCLNETGCFDEANFGLGYGEECDFSLRASALGWKHAVAADVFVYHEGEASFASEAMERKRLAGQTITKLYPNYQRLISDFVQADPLYHFRKNVDAIRLRTKPEDCAAILQEHFHYTRSLLERTADYHRAMVGEQEHRQYLEGLLENCNQQVATKDRALAMTQHIVSELKREIERLSEHIGTIEQSRSWRYTQWLRRK